MNTAKALILLACFVIATQAMNFSDAIAWARERNDRALGERKLSAGAYTPSPISWPDKIVYSIVVDRFNNGNLSNDKLNIPPEQKHADENDAPWDLWSWRHGGDIKGITDRLDYLADLGIGSLWITPILQNNGAYHAYCLTDPTMIDPGFGTVDELNTLVREAHKRGIYIILDIVVNHMCDRNTGYTKQPNHDQCPRDLAGGYWMGYRNTQSPNQGELGFSDSFFKPMKNQQYFSRCGADTMEEMQSESDAAVYGDFTGEMFDFDTRNPEFQKLFTELHKYWIAHSDIDGYRMDAAKHVTEDFLSYFSTTIRDYALTVGKTNFFIVGEVAASAEWIGRRLGKQFMNPDNPDQHGNVPLSLVTAVKDLKSTYQKHPIAQYPGLTAIYDFAESGNSRGMLLGSGTTGQYNSYFYSDYYNTIVGQNDYRLSWTLLEIHDWPRFVYSDPTNSQLSILGLGHVLTAPGTPVIYYGQEQGFNGRCAADSAHCGDYNPQVWNVCNSWDDSLKRQDMFIGGPWRLASTLGSMTNNAYIGRIKAVPSPHWTQDPFLDRTNAVFGMARRMARLRNSCSALRNGSMTVTWSEARTGALLGFLRKNNNQQVVVLINTGTDTINLDGMKFYIDRGISPYSGTRFLNAFVPEQVAFTGYVGSDAFLFTNGLSIIPRGVMVFIDWTQIQPFSNDLGIALCKW